MSTNHKSGTHRKESRSKATLDNNNTSMHRRGRSRQEREISYWDFPPRQGVSPWDVPSISGHYFLDINRLPPNQHMDWSRPRARSRSRHYGQSDGRSSDSLREPSPGHLLEYIASDGRRGTVARHRARQMSRSRERSRAPEPRWSPLPLTADNLSRVPSERLTRSTPSTIAITRRPPATMANANAAGRGASRDVNIPPAAVSQAAPERGGGEVNNNTGDAANDQTGDGAWANDATGDNGWNNNNGDAGNNEAGGTAWDNNGDAGNNDAGGSAWGADNWGNNDAGGSGWNNGDANNNDAGGSTWGNGGDASNNDTGGSAWGNAGDTANNDAEVTNWGSSSGWGNSGDATNEADAAGPSNDATPTDQAADDSKWDSGGGEQSSSWNNDGGNDSGNTGWGADVFVGLADVDETDGAKDEGSSAWTSEEDAKLIDMKKNNEQWKAIAAALSKDVQACQVHFKEIRPSDFRANPIIKGNKKGKGIKGSWGAKEEKGKQEEKEEKKDDGEEASKTTTSQGVDEQWDKAAKAFGFQNVSPEKKKAIADAFKDLQKAGITFSPDLATEDTRQSAKLVAKLVPDDNFSAQDLNLLAGLVAQDNKRVYARLAARFEELTTRRISEELIREKLTPAERTKI